MAPVRTDAASLLAARHVIALAALPVIAGLALQSSTASSTAQGLKPAATTPAAVSLLAPLSAANDRIGVTGVAGIASTAGVVTPTGISSGATPPLKSLADRVQQAIGKLVPSTPLTGGSALPAPSLALPPVPTVPPVPSLPPIGH
jgi:hypothetical protein